MVEQPKGVRTITLDELDRLGIGDDGGLYWDGKRVQTRVSLDGVTLFLAIAATLATVASSLIALLEFLV